MNKLSRCTLVGLAAIAVAGIGNAALAQSAVPPAPGLMPPIASHSDPTLPVPTTPPELIAPAPDRLSPQAQLDLRRVEARAWARFLPIADRKARGWAARLSAD